MKIDVSKIEGFENLSAEEKIAALIGYEMPDVSMNETEEVKKLKIALSKSNSEAADWKRQYREKLSDEERLAAERAESEKALKEELEQYRKEKTVLGYKDQYRSLGYSEDLALSTAQAMADGDTSTVFANQKAFLEEQIKVINAAALNKQPRLTGGDTPRPESIEERELAAIRKYAGL